MTILNRACLAVVLTALLLPATALAAGPTGPVEVCGTDPARAVVADALDQFQQRRRQRDGLPLKTTPTVYQEGQVAVIVNDGSLVTQTNPFDLHGKEMQYLRRPKGMSVVRARVGFKDLIGDRVDMGDDDSRFFEFPDGETFAFGEEVYDGLWVNSDGNLTFGAADLASTARDLGRFFGGPPRIAPLFADLDPSAATGDGGVYVGFLPGRMRVTWRDVPNFDSDTLNTVQVTLFFQTGRVLVVFGDQVETPQAVVGVRPFDAEADPVVMNYNEELPFRPDRANVAESFNSSQGELLDRAFPRAFFQTFDDRYDHVIFFLGFDQNLGGAFAYEITPYNEIEGIGLNVYDASAAWGSDSRLRSYVQMGTLSRYPDDPEQRIIGPGGFVSTLQLLGHETGHRWLAFAHFIDDSGAESERLLGRQKAHWAFNMHSEGSVMEGNDIIDNGGGSFTTSENVTSRYSTLDQYIMGLRPSELVEDFFWVQTAGAVATDAPRPNYTFGGTRMDVTVDQVIQAEGPRNPPFARAPKEFRMAFALVTNGNPDPEDIAKVDLYRQRFTDWFQEATDNRGTIKTALFPKQ